jgi:hypothetical protein
MQTPKSSKALSIAVLALAALTLCLPAVAEDEGQAPWRTVIKTTKYASVADIAKMVKVVDVVVAVDAATNQIFIRGPEANIETAIKVIEALDSPEPRWGIELMVHLVRASKDPVDSPAIPDDMKAAISELAELFNYRGFELVDTVFLRATADAGAAQVSTPLRDGGSFGVAFDTATVIYGEPKHLVRFKNLTLSSPSARIEIRPNGEVGEGHKVLIGKSSLHDAGVDADLVLIIEAKLKETWPPGTGE